MDWKGLTKELMGGLVGIILLFTVGAVLMVGYGFVLGGIAVFSLGGALLYVITYPLSLAFERIKNPRVKQRCKLALWIFWISGGVAIAILFILNGFGVWE